MYSAALYIQINKYCFDLKYEGRSFKCDTGLLQGAL